jgi:DNA-binding transcriptional ArsR family regulator
MAGIVVLGGSFGGLTAAFELKRTSKANVLQHLFLMRMMGIRKGRRNGKNVYYGIANGKITKACSLMQDALASLLEGVAIVRRNVV